MEALHDPTTGLRGFIAIHSTVRGPAFGGCRMRAYANEEEAIADASRLAEGMTLKNAMAGLPFGGGKAVILKPDRIADRRELFRSFGREVARLGGRYITAEDIGTTPADMHAVHSATSYVSGIARAHAFGGDPGPFTALGVFHAIETAALTLLHRRSLQGLRVGVQGIGAVGSELCGLLASCGAELWVCDIDRVRVAEARDRWDARIVSNEALFQMDLDVLSPCAVGGVLDASAAYLAQAKVIAGAANNQLVGLGSGDILHARGIWYLPDFLVNAGGIIAVAREYLGTGDEESVRREVRRISMRAEELVRVVKQTGRPPARVAVDWAKALAATAPSDDAGSVTCGAPSSP
jgi:leucine dehydrogenase